MIALFARDKIMWNQKRLWNSNKNKMIEELK